VHPVLGFLNSTGTEDPTDPTIMHYSTHYDLVTPNHFTHLHAEVDAVKNAVVLSKIEAALAVACLDSSILVKFESEAAANLFKLNITIDTVIPLEEEWNCAYLLLSIPFQPLFCPSSLSQRGTLAHIP
jgi:hypothetical protein